MDYISVVDLAGGLVAVHRYQTGLSLTYDKPGPTVCERQSLYGVFVRDDLKPKHPIVFFETAVGPDGKNIPNPQDFRPPLDELLAKLPQMPSDARKLIDLIYNTN